MRRKSHKTEIPKRHLKDRCQGALAQSPVPLRFPALDAFYVIRIFRFESLIG